MHFKTRIVEGRNLFILIHINAGSTHPPCIITIRT
ncbi:Uncharacterised protein [Vibrio cholerae]|nr:Uncharacterised protein [Vibrio cholerae]